MLIFNREARRFEYRTAAGDLVFVLPLAGGKTDDVDPRQVGTPTPATQSLVAKAERFLAGDTAAGAELDAELGGMNDEVTQAKGGTASSATQAAQQTATNAGTPATDQGGMLPSPAYLNAYVDVLSGAISLQDATEKLRLKEEQIVREAQRLGLPVDLQSLYGDPSQGVMGPFRGSEAAISEVAATNPDYLRAFGGIQNLAGVTEIGRRQNILARLADQIGERGRDVDLNTRVSEVSGGREALRKNFQREYLKAQRDPKVTQQELSEMVWAYEDELMAMDEAENRLIEAERPGYIAWKEGQAQGAINALPEHRRGDYNVREVAAGIRSLPNDVATDRDPNNYDMKVPTNLGAAQPQMTPAASAPQPPAAPVAPAAPAVSIAGQPPPGLTPEQLAEWERRQRERELVFEAPPLPTFAAGGVFSGQSFGGESGAGMSFNPARPGRPTVAKGMRADTQAPMPAFNSRQVQSSLQNRASQIQALQAERQAVRESFARERASILNDYERQKAAITARWQAEVSRNPFIAKVYNPQNAATSITPPAITYEPPVE